MCFSVEVSSGDGSRRNYTLYTHTHIIYKRGFRFMVHHHYYNQRPFSSRPPQGFFSFIIITILLLFSLPFLTLVFMCVYMWLVCIPFQVYTASRVNTRRSLVIFGTLTQIQTYINERPGDLYSKWFSISRGSDEMELTCWPEGLSLSVGSK